MPPPRLPWMTAPAVILVLLMVLCSWCLHYAEGADPHFDPTTLMRLVLVPADATVGSVIYRLRANDDDFDYPLHFDLVGTLLDAQNQFPKISTILL